EKITVGNNDMRCDLSRCMVLQQELQVMVT
ncbi:MAG: hypothetical protein ACJA2P_002568, partial [Rhodoferax sp.]